MNNSQAIEATLFVSPHPDVVKRASVPSLILSSALIVAGLGVFISAFQLNDKASSIGMLLLVVGTAALLMGVFRLFWKSKHLVYAPTGSVTKESSLFFDPKYMDKLISLLEEGTFPLESCIKTVGNGNLRLDILRSQDSKFAAVQLFQFVPYTYNPVTKVFYFTGDKALALNTYLQQSKR
ncbi:MULTISPECIES: hypothetical protein [unclassified Bacteroides]|uniref:hypothetical protein n=1 Tax=unclassified Bacteroides TaxID=2646097 RepID=UPI000E7DF90C|nr:MULTISPECIES: hypothetical protein [unclassified Bacteroides]RGN46699.1 hypothetical protein DXB63_10795 [Bacteroides sp. OM05-12]RHR74693.1 hypothetical protein DWW69_12960 [Bacteroides sp. AF16-49]